MRIAFIIFIYLASLNLYSQEKRLALVIGNSDYKHSGKLKNPKNDAELIAATLEDLGFDVIKTTDASKAEMDKILLDFWRQLSKYEVALFYYAGHGVQFEGKNYLLPIDAKVEDFLALEIEAIDVERVVRQFQRFPSNINIVILDACRENPFQTWYRGSTLGFAPMAAPSGSIIAYATAIGATASDGTGINGLYTSHLSRQMVKPQRIEDVFIETRNAVRKESGGKQNPQEWSQLNGKFMLAKPEMDSEPPVIKILRPEMKGSVPIQSSSSNLTVIGEVTDNNQVSLLMVNNKIQELDETGWFSENVELTEGENIITFVAIDDHRNVTELITHVQHIPVAPSLANEILETSKYYAMIIGVDQYRDKQLDDLESPVKDAQKLSQVLSSRYNFDNENIILLTNPTREDLIINFDALAKTITKDDNLLLFYAGHGMWDEDAMVGYWLPSDAELKSTANWFPNSTVVDYLKGIKSKHTLLIVDAVFGGSIYKTRGIPDIEKVYRILYELPSRNAMTCGNLTEVSGQSSFMRYTIQRLEENHEPYLTSEELFASIRIAVINNSNSIPQYGEISNVGDEGGDFIFLLRE